MFEYSSFCWNTLTRRVSLQFVFWTKRSGGIWKEIDSKNRSRKKTNVRNRWLKYSECCSYLCFCAKKFVWEACFAISPGLSVCPEPLKSSVIHVLSDIGVMSHFSPYHDAHYSLQVHHVFHVIMPFCTWHQRKSKGILFCAMQVTPKVKTERHNPGRRQGAWRSLQVPEMVFVSPYLAIFVKLMIITDGNCRKHMNHS